MVTTQQLAADVLVIGAGVAALRAAIAARETGAEVILSCKGIAGRSGNTIVSTADISAYIPEFGTDDSVETFVSDTLQTGGSIADERLVQLLAERSGQALLDLERLGITLLRDGDHIDRTRGAGHSRARTYRADSKGLGPNKGLALSLPLTERARSLGVQCLNRAPVVHIQVDDGRIVGAVAVDLSTDTILEISTPTIVLAAGGASHLFARTNGTVDATGDAVLMAIRCGATARDLEFVQWHPTRMDDPVSLFLTNGLLSDGAVFRDAKGRGFMTDYDARGDLAPRDVLAKAIYTEARLGHGSGDGVYLDCSAISEERIALRHAYLASVLRERGVDFPKQWLVVSPATHFSMGGVAIDDHAASSLPGLFVAGESAGGIHGSNRLGGNAFCEGLVFGTIAGASAARYASTSKRVRLARAASDDLLSALDCAAEDPKPNLTSSWHQVRQTMWHHVSLVREAEGIAQATQMLDALAAQAEGFRGRTAAEAARVIELRAGIDCARAIASAASFRTESRGAHWRVDFPDTSPGWLGSVILDWPATERQPSLAFHPKAER